MATGAELASAERAVGRPIGRIPGPTGPYPPSVSGVVTGWHNRSVRVIHTSDWQLGMHRVFLGPEDAQPRFEQARLDAVRRVLELAGREGAAAILVAGDAFDDNQVAERTLARAIDVLAGSPVPVVIVPGNHDSLEPASVYRRWTPPPTVVVPVEPGVLEIAPGLEVVAAPFPTRHPARDLVGEALEDLGPPAVGVVRVLVAHGQLRTYGQDPTTSLALDPGQLRKALEGGIVHYVALGDRHSRTEYLDHDPGGRIWHSGTPEVTDARDPDPGWALVVDLEPGTGRCQVDARKVGTWQFLSWDRYLAEDGDVEDLASGLKRLPDKERVALWLTLTGQLRVGQRARLEEVLDASRHALAGLHVVDDDLATVPAREDLVDLRLGGYADRAADELRRLADAGGPAARTAQDALALLVRLAGSVPNGKPGLS